MTPNRLLCALCVPCVLCVVPLFTQGRSAPDWTTEGADAQRSSWIAVDPWLSLDSMPRFTFLWKLEVDNEARQMNALTAPASMANLNSFRGFKSLVFVGGSSNNVYAIDYDFGTLFWKTHFNYSSGVTEYAGSPACPGGMTAGVTRPTNLAATLQLPFMGFARPPRPAKGEVGEPGKGAPGLTPEPPARGRGAAAAGRGAPPPAAPAAVQGGRGRVANAIFAVGSDGIVRALNPINGDAMAPSVKFVPPNANVTGLIHIEGFTYAVTSSACGSAPDALWAMDWDRDDKAPVSWKSGGGPLSDPAFASDGTIYATVGDGTSTYADSVVALEAKTLVLKDWFAEARSSASPRRPATPLVFAEGGKTYVAASGSDGRVYLLDGRRLGASDHKTPLAVSPPSSKSGLRGLSTWRDGRGSRWILAAAHDTDDIGAIVAFRVNANDNAARLDPAWTSRDLVAPHTAIVTNGVVFALSGGNSSTPAVLYALDPVTGKEIWTSGNTITSFATAGLSAGTGQVYVVTHDNIVWAFGVPQAH